MKKIIHLSLLLFAIILFSGDLSAQGFNKKNRYVSYGGSINAMNYVGELDPGPSFIAPAFKFTKPNLGLCLVYRIQPRVSVRGNLSYGRIKGSDAENANYTDKNIHRRVRNLHFRSDIVELKADVIFDLFENRGPYKKRPDYTPYGFIGLAYFFHNPKAQTPDGNWVALKPLMTENKSYSLHQIAIPFGVGFRYKLSRQLDLAFEIGWRYTFTDYLDDVSYTYADKSSEPNSLSAQMADRSLEGFDFTTNTLPRDPELGVFITESQGILVDGQGAHVNTFGREGDKRGDKNKDWYVVTGFHLTYIIPGRVICPKFR